MRYMIMEHLSKNRTDHIVMNVHDSVFFIIYDYAAINPWKK